MDDEHPIIHQRHNDGSSQEWCPFCSIAKAYSPVSPQDTSNVEWNPEKLSPPAYVLLSTEHVIAFLDLAPLHRGHVLVSPRKHYVKVGHLPSELMAEVGRVMPIVARSAMQAVLPDIAHDEVDYNIVQNNGPGAAQVIEHVHFHVIPRPPLGYKAPEKDQIATKYGRAKTPTGLAASFIQFGRGARSELDDDDAALLVVRMREVIAEQWEKEFPTSERGTGSTDVPRRISGTVHAGEITAQLRGRL